MAGPESTQKDSCDLLRFRLDRPTAGDARPNREREQDTWRPAGDDASDECDSEKGRERDRVRAPDSARQPNEREHDGDSEEEELRRAIRRLPSGGNESHRQHGDVSERAGREHHDVRIGGVTTPHRPQPERQG